MNDRYEVFATHGKGVFSTVLRARDKKPVDEKNNPLMVCCKLPFPSHPPSAAPHDHVGLFAGAEHLAHCIGEASWYGEGRS